MRKRLLDIFVRWEKGIPSFRVTGELDLATLPVMRTTAREALDAGARFLVVDLWGVTYIDGEGVRALLQIREDCRRRGGDLILLQRSPIVSKVFRLVGIQHVFSIRIPDTAIPLAS